MIWRSLISFSIAASAIVAAATVSGQVELTNSHEPAVRRHNDYAGVVLWLAPVDRPTVQPPPPRRFEMKQRDKQFVPHVLAVPIGATVDFPNFDPIFHNAFSNFSGQPFDVGLYPPGTNQSVTFRTAGIVRVFCHIHSTMSAIIAVIPTPWYALTPESGRFSIPNVPPGEYDLHIFHERALPNNLKFLERRIAIPENGLVLPLISISETGFLPAPHLNKYGQPYPPKTNGDVYLGGK